MKRSPLNPLPDNRRCALGGFPSPSSATLVVAILFLSALLTAATVHGTGRNDPGAGGIEGSVSDSAGAPLAGAAVLLRDTPFSALTSADGSFRIDGLAAGLYNLEARRAGFRAVRLDGIVVREGATTAVRFRLEADGVGAHQPAPVPSPARERTQEKAASGAGDTVTRSAVPRPEGRATPPDASSLPPLQENLAAFDWTPPPGAPGRAAPPIPTTGGTRLPNDGAFDSMFFQHYGVNPFITTDEDPLSTFALDVDNASFTLARSYLERGEWPDPASVRVEEFVNYLPQEYPGFSDQDFRIFLEGAPSRFGAGYELVRVGLKARSECPEYRRPVHLTFVIDCSGSMARGDRLGLVQSSLRMLVDRLQDGDRVGIVMFQTDARVILEPVVLGRRPPTGHPSPRGWDSARGRLLDAIDRLQADGSTNAEAGLRLGYEMARRSYSPGAANRVILCSDGVANEGFTGAQSILERVRDEADRGIRLTAVGCGMGNYNDVLLEQLADRGDGNYFYVDSPDEARRVLVDGLARTMMTVAEDAKIQVEFDPARVIRYRLLGFENRDLADRDFRNDRVDAGEAGPDQEVTALYEIKLAPGVDRGRLATVRVRYGRPREESGGEGRVREISAVLDARQLCPRFESASPWFQLAAAGAEFAEILRGSYWAKESRVSDVLPVARDAARALRESRWGSPDAHAADGFAELVTMLEQAERIEEPLSRNGEE